MRGKVQASVDELDRLYETLSHDLGGLLNAAELTIVEMDRIDDLRAALTHNGDRLIDAREARRSAIRARTTAAERCDQARLARQRAQRISKELDAASFRARTLVDTDPV